MNPFDGLPVETLQMILVYSWLGVVVFGVLGVWEIDKARRRVAAKAKQPAASPFKTVATWLRCPTGCCKVLADHEMPCPVCGLALTSDKALLTETATGRIVGTFGGPQ